MNNRVNNLWFGLITGIILPVIVLFLIALFASGEESIPDFFSKIIGRNVFTHIISLGAIPNLLLFFIFIWTDRLRAARGVLLATFLLAFFVLIIKILS